MEAISRRGFILVIALLLLLGPFGSYLPITAQGVHSVELSDLDPQEGEVEVLWGKMGHATLTGSVTVEKPPTGAVEVNLVPYCSKAWTVMVYPDFMKFENAGTKHFTVNVDVSLYSMAHEQADIEVVAHAKFPDTTTQEDQTTATLKVKPIYAVYVSSDPEIGTRNPQKFKLIITNMGNGPDSFTLTTANQDYLEENGFTLIFGTRTTKEMIPREWDQITLEVSYKSTTKWGEHTIKLNANSIAAEMEGSLPSSTTFEIVMEIEALEGGTPQVYTFISIIIIAIILVTAMVIVRRRKDKRKKKG
jgi:hypothetical protein